MQENGIYFAKNEYYSLIRQLGGIWNDTKDRPIVCLIEDKKNNGLYWAIPMGAWEHRDNLAKQRIEDYLNKPDSEIQSCFYHLGKTTQMSIFFISDAVPIIEKYIAREYIGKSGKIHIIKKPELIEELNRKLQRILYFESKNPNYFRQHITDMKNKLIQEIKPELVTK